MAIDGVEVWNRLRTSHYSTGISWFADCDVCELLMPSDFVDCGTDPSREANPDICKDDPQPDCCIKGYSSPAGDPDHPTEPENPAPWYDPDVPESLGFFGFMPLDVEGIDDSPYSRTISTGVTGGGVAGPRRTGPRKVVVTGILIGVHSASVSYGMAWLTEVLAGCNQQGQGRCGGACMTMFEACPPGHQFLSKTTGEMEYAVGSDIYRARFMRTLRNVTLVEGPKVTERDGTSGVDIPTVEFTLSVGGAWAWTNPIPLAPFKDLELPRDDTDECITWCLHDKSGRKRTKPEPVCIEPVEDCHGSAVAVPVDGKNWHQSDEKCTWWPVLTDAQQRELREDECDKCRWAPCEEEPDCSAPGCGVPSPPVPEGPSGCFCQPVVTLDEIYEIDLSEKPMWFGSTPIIELDAGPEELHNVSIEFFERKPNHANLTKDEVVAAQRCDPVAVYNFHYVPANGAAIVDGQVNRAWVTCEGVCQPSRDVYGRDGGPLTWNELTCDQYVVRVSTNALRQPSKEATLNIYLTEREVSSGKGGWKIEEQEIWNDPCTW